MFSNIKNTFLLWEGLSFLRGATGTVQGDKSVIGLQQQLRPPIKLQYSNQTPPSFNSKRFNSSHWVKTIAGSAQKIPANQSDPALIQQALEVGRERAKFESWPETTLAERKTVCSVARQCFCVY